MFAKMSMSIFKVLGVGATYYEPVDKFPMPCRVIVDQDVLISKENYDFDQGANEYGTVIEFLKADFSVDPPERGGIFVISFDEEWELTHPISQDGVFEKWVVVKHD